MNSYWSGAAISVIALAAAWFALRETPTPWQFGGAACVIAGLFLARR